MPRHISEDIGDYALYRKLYQWALLGNASYHRHLFGSQGKQMSRIHHFSEDDDVEKGSVKVYVEADTESPAMEISIFYWTESLRDGKEYIAENPAIMVDSTGKVFRTHGDFHRIRRWVENLSAPALDTGSEGG
jgi:hypothetical protein